MHIIGFCDIFVILVLPTFDFLHHKYSPRLSNNHVCLSSDQQYVMAFIAFPSFL